MCVKLFPNISKSFRAFDFVKRLDVKIYIAWHLGAQGPLKCPHFWVPSRDLRCHLETEQFCPSSPKWIVPKISQFWSYCTGKDDGPNFSYFKTIVENLICKIHVLYEYKIIWKVFRDVENYGTYWGKASPFNFRHCYFS